MSLSGKLEIFPLEEVLRLLARSHLSGCLRVEGPGAGRIYLEGGSMTYAAVEPDEALRSHLLAAGVVTEAGLSALDLSNGPLTEALAPDASTAALAEVVREQCVESVYRIRKPQSGPFSFAVDSRPRYVTGQSFDIEMVISEADRRATEWADIEEVVPHLETKWHMVPAIEEESVKLSDTAWRFLAGLEGAGSVRDLAGRLGMTEFQAARRMAELSRARLVEELGVAPAQAEPESFSFPAAAPVDPWTEPTAVEETGQPIEEAVAEPSPEPAAERSWWEEEPAAAAQPTSDEGFLENVFGSLDQAEAEAEEAAADAAESPEGDEDAEAESGFGLLRRRGLGAAFRELADS